jgi:DNA-binding transcriptional LysR family regulator
MDRIQSMSTLLAVVEAGSLSAAARALAAPLSTVSRRIAELEEHLGTGLLIRTSRKLELTEAGQAYIVACKRILADLEEAELTAAGEYSAPRGDLVITAPIVFGRLHVLPVVTDFLAAYPEIDIRLRLADRVFDLVEEHVDLAVRIGELPDSSLLAAKVGEVRMVACASPAYLEARGTPRNPEQLKGHSCVTFGALGPAQVWTFAREKGAREKGGDGKGAITVPVRPRLAVNTAEAAVDAAIASVGITRVLSYQAASALRSGALAAILKGFEPAAAPVSLVHAGQPLMPLKTRAFLDFAAPRLKKRLREETRR